MIRHSWEAASWAHSRRIIVPAMLIVVLVVLSACGTTEDNGDSVRPTPLIAETPGGGVTLEVEAVDFQFATRRFQLKQDQAATIELQNGGSAKHSLKVYRDDEYKEPVDNAEIPPVDPGQSDKTTLNPPEQVRELYFRCEIHHEMTGEIEVGPA